ncbi:MAG: hypothetical protein LBH79_01930 [Nitrososphaerota archaeon]|nr:hypothetical protein [Nitrososphaerota archaeon]
MPSFNDFLGGNPPPNQTHPHKDTIWGVWPANSTSQQIWNQVQIRLNQYGTKLDIVYEDPNYSVADLYRHVYYWNQTD